MKDQIVYCIWNWSQLHHYYILYVLNEEKDVVYLFVLSIEHLDKFVCVVAMDVSNNNGYQYNGLFFITKQHLSTHYLRLLIRGICIGKTLNGTHQPIKIKMIIYVIGIYAKESSGILLIYSAASIGVQKICFHMLHNNII